MSVSPVIQSATLPPVVFCAVIMVRLASVGAVSCMVCTPLEEIRFSLTASVQTLTSPALILSETARANGITRTALITVGRFLDSDFSRSCLYDPEFSTGFREASR